MNDNLIGQFLPLRQSNILLPYRGGYTVTMRESEGTFDVLKELADLHKNKTIHEPKLHMGWGSYRNLDIIVASQAEYAILCDVSLRQLDIWSRTFMAINLANTPKEFVNYMTSSLPQQPRPRFFGYSIEYWLEENLKVDGSWLHKQESFDYIKKMVSQNKIETICCDIREPFNDDNTSMFSQLKSAILEMQQKNICIPNTLYLTNLPWMMKNELGFFGEKHHENKFDMLVGLRLMLENLKYITPLFDTVVSAHTLAKESSSDNLQWLTHIYKPNDFIKELENELH